MKLITLFSEFLDETVNLNSTRFDKLESSIDAIKNFIRQSEWDPRIRGFEAQGSWAHHTIIKPPDQGEFDADLLVMVDPVDGWTAADYVKSLGKIFKDSATYGGKSKTWDYCVTVTYANESKIDIAPCVKGRRSTDSLEVCNRKRDRFEDSEPTKYTQWIKDRNSISGANSFRKVTRLIKYLRDIKSRFTCSSVLLTTLLGYRIGEADRDAAGFVDTPTTLKTIMQRLDDWLQARPIRPQVLNPHLQSEDFATAWTDDQYVNFRTMIHRYRGWIDEAYDTVGRAESITAWRRVFGPDFAKGEPGAVTKSAAGLALFREAYSATAAHLDSMVEYVRDFGVSLLPPQFFSPPHMQQPRWTKSASFSTQYTVTAVWNPGGNSDKSRPVRSGQILPAKGGLEFNVYLRTVEPLPEDVRVEWRITNTGSEAFARQARRGRFYAADSDNTRWESLAYRGAHIAEAFIIHKRSGLLVGQSPPFVVVIE